MEEEKAAALYEELTRKGGGAARFKQGLGFSDGGADNPPPSRGSALPTSSFMSSFVKASSPSRSKELEKQSQIETIQNKLKKKVPSSPIGDKIRVSDRDRRRDRSRSRSRSRSRDRGISRRDRDSSRDRDRDRGIRRRYRSSSRERRRDRDRDRDSSRERRRDRDRDSSRERRRRDRESSRERGRERKRSRSLSPKRRTERGIDGGGRKGRVVKKELSSVVDYGKLIDGYDKMTPAEKVKAKMKLQLSQTAAKDEKMGVGSQWERFDFDKDAPIEEEVLEAADDDAAVSKRIGQSFRFASLEGKREDIIRNAHDEAMFGVPVSQPSQSSSSEDENENGDKPTSVTDTDQASSLLNEKVISKQQGSWRDRARRNVG